MAIINTDTEARIDPPGPTGKSLIAVLWYMGETKRGNTAADQERMRQLPANTDAM